jgi:hypothetical protein
MRTIFIVPSGTAAADCAHDSGLSTDLLVGSSTIAAFIFGDPSRARAIYRLETKRWPIFRLGRELAARRSALTTFIAAQERGTCA